MRTIICVGKPVVTEIAGGVFTIVIAGVVAHDSGATAVPSQPVQPTAAPTLTQTAASTPAIPLHKSGFPLCPNCLGTGVWKAVDGKGQAVEGRCFRCQCKGFTTPETEREHEAARQKARAEYEAKKARLAAQAV